MSDIVLKPINSADHFADALDLAGRARDYVLLETGHAPDSEFIRQFFEESPPGLGPDSLIHFAIMQNSEMAGMIAASAGYERPDDWWIGLMLMDPAYRGRGIGASALKIMRRLARLDGISMLKLAVLDANPRARKFWDREGFELHRLAPATPDSDGHDRTVLKYIIRETD